MKKTITIVLHSSEYGTGAEISIVETAKNLRKDFTVTFLIRKPLRGLEKLLQDEKFKYRAIYYTSWAQHNMPTDLSILKWRAKKNKQAVSEIENALVEYETDIVMTNTTVIPWGALAANNQHLPHIWYLREYCDPDSGYQFSTSNSEMYHDIEKLSDKVFVNSPQLKEYVDGNFLKTKSLVFQNPINIEQIKKLAQETVNNPFTSETSLKLITVGTIKKSKGQYTVMEAVDELNNAGEDIEYCVIGKPSTKEEEKILKETIKNLSYPDKIHVLGFKANPNPYIKLSDVGVTLSDKEAFGRTTIEYMALQKPVIGHRSGATQELVKNNFNGITVTSLKTSDVAKAVRVYRNKVLLQKHADCASKQLKSIFNPEKSSKQMIREIQEIEYKDKLETSIEKYLDEILSIQLPLREKLKQVKYILRDFYLRIF